MSVSLKQSVLVLALGFSIFNLVACTTTGSEALPSESALEASTESQSLTDLDASSAATSPDTEANTDMTVEEPTAEENAALAEAASTDFADPKDLELGNDSKTVPDSASDASVSTSEAPSDTVAPIEGEVMAEPMGLEGASLETPTLEDTEATIAGVESELPSISPILFGVNKSKLSRAHKKELNELAKVLKEDCKAKIVVSGHSDNRGSAQYNKNLALKRAKAVKSYLVARGVKSKQIQVESHGKSKLLAFGDSEAEQAQNRRVEIQYLAH